MANRNFLSNKLYQLEAYPVLLSCLFTVAAADTGGLGITNLNGAGIKSVFMHTSSTPAGGNPNPASGIIQVQLQDNYSRLLGVMSAVAAPTTGSALTSVTANVLYVINALGTATLAQFQAKGLPVGVTPTVGQAFIATATGTIGGSASVKVSSVSGISDIELVGIPNTNLQNANSPVNGGGIVMLQCLAPTNSSTTTPIATAPADGTIIRLDFYLSNSSVTVQGQ